MARPYDSTGMDQAMSDQRVRRLSLHVNRENRAHRRADWVHVTVWDRGLPEAQAPDWYRLDLTETGYELTVEFADGRQMGMYQYLRDEAANAVRRPRRQRRPRPSVAAFQTVVQYAAA